MYFLYAGWKKGNKCRFARQPGRNRREERYLPAHISESVKATRHPGGHVTVAADATAIPGDNPGYPGAGTRAVRFALVALSVCARVYVRIYVSGEVDVRVGRRVVHITRAQECRARPGTSECRRLYDGCVGFDVT